MILRKRFKDGYQVNYCLNGEYHLIDKENCPEAFRIAVKTEFGETGMEKLTAECYAFVHFVKPNGLHVNEPLYMGQESWIMSLDGQYFANLTHR